MFMNDMEIDDAVHRFRTHPVLGPAARFLRDFAREVDRCSDGWCYWKPPVRAAKQLQTLVYGHLFAGMGAYPVLPPPTRADVLRTLSPIKAFMTRKGTQAGMTMPRLSPEAI